MGEKDKKTSKQKGGNNETEFQNPIEPDMDDRDDGSAPEPEAPAKDDKTARNAEKVAIRFIRFICFMHDTFVVEKRRVKSVTKRQR